MNPLIEIRQINKRYPMGTDYFYALKSVSLSIEQGEYIAITGKSGSGKSTLMNIIGCLDNPTDGSYFLAGSDVSSLTEIQLSRIRNRSIGFIFQSFNLLARATVLSNVMQPLIYRQMRNRDRRTMAIEALEKVKLSNKLANLPNELSGGQRQRVAIARALVTSPKILLGDEPTGNLDSKTTHDIMKLFDEIRSEGNTIILVTHEQEIADHCERVIEMADGNVVAKSKSGGFKIAN